LALSPRSNLTQPGDTVAILLGCQVPVVVRQHADHYEFVEICYVHGIIQGEAWWDWRLGSARFNSLILDDAPVVARLMAYELHETSQISEFRLVGQSEGLNHFISSSSLPCQWVAVGVLSTYKWKYIFLLLALSSFPYHVSSSMQRRSSQQKLFLFQPHP
jgi:hypothetical protein